MRRHLQIAVVAIIALTVLLVTANSLIRLSSRGEDSYGIVEHWLFGKSAPTALARVFQSREFTLWDDATKRSAEVAALLTEKGPALISDPGLEEERARAALLARSALDDAIAISDNYLASSNPDLPLQYKTHFVQGMRLIAEGLDDRDRDRVLDGITHYNAFLAWIQARSRDDFKALK